MAELCDLVSEDDLVLGCADRRACHRNPAMIHRAVHVLIFDSRARLLLQKRHRDKLVQPGRWDSSVGGHVEAGEGYLAAARREMEEELGLTGIPLTFLYHSKIRNSFESENIATFLARYDGSINFSTREIEEARYWTPEEIEKAIGESVLTPNFEEEWIRWKEWCRRYPSYSEKPVGFCAGDTFPDLFSGLKEG